MKRLAINETSKWSFLCFRVSGHFPSTGILDLLYADNFMFTKPRSGSGSNFFKIVKVITLQRNFQYQFCMKQEFHSRVELLTY